MPLQGTRSFYNIRIHRLLDPPPNPDPPGHTYTHSLCTVRMCIPGLGRQPLALRTKKHSYVTIIAFTACWELLYV